MIKIKIVLQACFVSALLLLTACGGGGGGGGTAAATTPPTTTTPPVQPPVAVDTDGDGMPNDVDPDDDNDGLTDVREATLGTNPLLVDSDSDGVNDSIDAFPLNRAESVDSDRDGTGDNSDAFPNDPTETTDTDGDMIGDNTDVFPTNDARSASVAAVGNASVSTCYIGVATSAPPTSAQCSKETGSVKINDVDVSSDDYLNFLMTGGNGTVDVGIKLYSAGTQNEVFEYKSDSCNERFVNTETHWRHIDLRGVMDSTGTRVPTVDIEIFDNETTGDCGFIAFDHLYLSNKLQGTAAE